MESDEELKAWLKTWRAEPKVPDSFQREVWQRIAVRKSGRKGLLFGWAEEIVSALIQPGYAAAMAGLMVATGLAVAHLQAQQANAKDWKSLEARYALSINPELITQISR
jgi:hypothetical protein